MKDITIYTNEILNGWNPNDLKTKGLGGSEEAITYLACEFAKLGHKVNVYTTLNDVVKGESISFNDVNFHPHSNFFHTDSFDVFISFKNYQIWQKGITAEKKIHFSLEVEPFWKREDIDSFVFTSNFHRNRHPWVAQDKAHVIPLGVNAVEKSSSKEAGRLLYCSSPDRGLLELLGDWKEIKKNSKKKLTLKIAYSFSILEKIAEKNPNAASLVKDLKELMKQDGVEYLGSLNEDQINEEYQQAEYWILPLQNPESELFCLNAVKSRLAGCIPIANKLGALNETVGSYIPYDNFVKGKTKLHDVDCDGYGGWNWGEIVKLLWNKLI